jgi:hypothetical protein
MTMLFIVLIFVSGWHGRLGSYIMLNDDDDSQGSLVLVQALVLLVALFTRHIAKTNNSQV